MSKQLVFGLVVAFALGAGLWLYRRGVDQPFSGFHGAFVCEGVGIPDITNNTIAFEPEGILWSGYGEVGKYFPSNDNLARLEVSMEMVHRPNFMLNPLAEHVFEGIGDRVILIGRQQGKELYRYTCIRER
jgi:hypothetical protein